MATTTYLFFDGTCEDAFKFYETVFGARTEALIKYDQMPGGGQSPAPETIGKVMHGRLALGGTVLLASDVCPPGRYSKPQGFRVMHEVATVEDGKRIFDALSQGGTVDMPYGETFWAKGFGMVTDRFGTPWMVNCGKPM